ncbi:MAG: hypothetical protein J0I06_23505 [Planctomycetes bacterium]|nr:hypothetical protein [Planctomycetota bacterium]
MQPTNPASQPAADDHAPMGPPPPEVIARGYEADVYDAKSVISVPLLVVFFFVLAFGTVTVIFRFIAYPKADPRVHPAAAERNKRPLNERLAGIGHDDQAKQTREQPRLEVLRQRTGGDLARAITRPETAEGNSPELHPEDLRATKEHYPALFQTGGGKYGIDKVLDLGDDKLKALFPVQADGSRPIDSQHAPSASNAGRGGGESPVVRPPVPKIEGKKPEAPKKPETPKQPEAPKKSEPKPGEKK